MTQIERFNDMQTDVAGLSLDEALAASNAGTLLVWMVNYWEWVKNPLPGGAHPPHKPPF